MVAAVQRSLHATFDANGDARVSGGPTIYGETWQIDRMVISTTSLVETECRVYLNAESPANLVDSTYTANANTSETNISIQTLETLVFVWSKGTPNKTATAVLYGRVN